jgi:hypothetical protein
MFDTRTFAFRFIPITPDARVTLVPRLFPEEDLIEHLRRTTPVDCVSALAAVYDVAELRQIADELDELLAYLTNITTKL